MKENAKSKDTQNVLLKEKHDRNVIKCALKYLVSLRSAAIQYQEK